MNRSEKILIIRNDHIGDLVLSTHVFKEIKKLLPNTKITLITSKINRPLIEKDKNIDKIIEFKIPEYNFRTIWDFLKMSFQIRKEKFDIGIDLRGSLMNSFFLLWFSGIKKRISRIDLHKNISFFLTNPININPNKHIIEDNLEIINKGLSINGKNKWPNIITDSKDKKKVDNFLKINELKKYICICPIARLKHKQWDLNNFKKVLIWLEKYNLKILLIGTKKDEKILKELSVNNKNSLVVINFNLRKMSLLFKKSDLVLAQDGGPMHIAWISGAKLISLFPMFSKQMIKMVPLKNSIVLKAKNGDMRLINLVNVKKEIKKILFKNLI